jgi:hypothetical protein
MAKRLLLLIALLVTAGCGDWVSKLAPQETTFARHCFELLQRRDFAAIEALASPELRTADFPAQLSAMAAQIPAEAPISSQATNVNVQTTNGYTISTIGMAYRFPSGWLEFDVSAAGSDAPALTAIRLQPTTAPVVLAFAPALIALPLAAGVLVLIGVLIYRRRTKREGTPLPVESGRPSRSLLRWSGDETIELISPLPQEECIARLRQAVGSEWSLSGGAPAIGRVGDASFRIRKRLPAAVHNSFQTRLRGTLSPAGTGTHLHCHLGMHPLIGIFMPLWFCLVLAFAAGWIVIGVERGATGMQFWAGLIIPVFMLVFGVGLIAFGRFLARNERPFLLDFLRQTVDAQPIARQEPAAVVQRR